MSAQPQPPDRNLAMELVRVTEAAAMAAGDSVRKAASRCDIDKNTSLRWRHRFLRAARGHRKGTKLGGVTEMDIAYLRRSEKGSRTLSGGRKARRRGGPKKTDEALVPILTGVERGGDWTLQRLVREVRVEVDERQDRQRVVVQPPPAVFQFFQPFFIK